MPLKSIGQAMDEFGAGTLHSGKGGPLVQKRKQAIAIGLNAERRAGRPVAKKKRKKSRKGGALAQMLFKRYRPGGTIQA